MEFRRDAMARLRWQDPPCNLFCGLFGTVPKSLAEQAFRLLVSIRHRQQTLESLSDRRDGSCRLGRGESNSGSDSVSWRG